jgi:hypothetical protein
MKARVSLYLSAVLCIAALGLSLGCNKAPNDSQITSQVQSKFSQDSGLQGKQLSVQSADGVVTLSGTVDNQIERDAAARQAAAVSGVREVVNNLQVASATSEPPADQAAQAAPAPEPKPRAYAKPRAAARPRNLPTSSHGVASNAPSDDSASLTPVSVPSTPVAPPAPKKVTIPSGTTMAVRLVDTIDSETAQPGQSFRATLDSPLAVEGDVAIPAGYDVEGHIVDAKSAGKFAGQSVIALQLDRIAVNGKYYNIQTDQYRRQGTSRGKNTAEKVGAGAGIGAIIGAIAGGGKGAAIGAAAGGGLGGGVQAATKGQQIKLPTETVLNFTLQGPLTVVATSQTPDSGRPRLARPDSNTNNNQ